MPFDYNSFMQGVQTGLRLGRTSPGRVPPMPPVPSGRYILTESGGYVLTETKDYGDISVYQMDVTYQANTYANPNPDAPVVGSATIRICPSSFAYSPEIQYLFARITSGTIRGDLVYLVVFCDADKYDRAKYGPIFNRYIDGKYNGPFANALGIVQEIAYAVVFYGYNVPIYVPLDAGVFVGSLSELVDMLASVKNKRMITEGADNG